MFTVQSGKKFNCWHYKCETSFDKDHNSCSCEQSGDCCCYRCNYIRDSYSSVNRTSQFKINNGWEVEKLFNLIIIININ